MDHKNVYAKFMNGEGLLYRTGIWFITCFMEK